MKRTRQMFFAVMVSVLPLCPVNGSDHPYSHDFLDYIKSCENGIQKGWSKRDGKWYPYYDGSGWHIAYGHLIDIGEYKFGITEEQALSFLISDLNNAGDKADKYFDKIGYDFHHFPEKSKEIVLDFTFNGCLYSHPKMMLAVATNDVETQREEYKRYAVLDGKRVEIKDRNTRFYNRYLK